MVRKPLSHPLSVTVQLGQEIRRRRLSARITVVKLAARANITPNYLGDIETGRRNRNPSLSTVLAIAKALGVGLPELLGARPRNLEPASLEVARMYELLPKALQPIMLRFLRAISREPRVRRFAGH